MRSTVGIEVCDMCGVTFPTAWLHNRKYPVRRMGVYLFCSDKCMEEMREELNQYIPHLTLRHYSPMAVHSD